MMRKEDVDRFALARPFTPFEVRMNDGQRFRFRRVEEFLVGRTALMTLDRRGNFQLVNMGLISTVGPLRSDGRRRPRRNP
jgi:hypothetical protein